MKTFLIPIYFIVFLGFTMQSQAQTKEETIGWLKEKLSNNMLGRISYTVDVNDKKHHFLQGQLDTLSCYLN